MENELTQVINIPKFLPLQTAKLLCLRDHRRSQRKRIPDPSRLPSADLRNKSFKLKHWHLVHKSPCLNHFK